MKKFAAAAVGVIVVAGGATAFASIPDPSGVVTACVKKDGNVKIIDTDDSRVKERVCGKDEKTVTWNQVGQPGPAGPAGLTMFANVRADGALANGGAATAATKFDPAVFGSGYVVTFNRPVAACAAVASPGQTGIGVAQTDAIASSNVDTVGIDKVFVQFKSSAGALVDTDFHLILACG